MIPEPAWDDPARTAERPMAFTRADLLYGAWITWLAFVTLMLGTLTVAAVATDLGGAQPGWGPFAGIRLLPVALPLAAAIGGPVSAVVVALMLPLVAVVARRMSGVSSVSVHLAVHATLGAAVGVAVCAVYAALNGMPLGDLVATWWTTAVVMAVCAAATAFGWWRAMRRALRPPRGAARGIRRVD